MLSENYDKWLEYCDWLNCYYLNTSMEFYYNAEIEFITEIIKNKLYFATTYGESGKLLNSTQDALYFTTDEELIYLNYYYDFGPLNIACLYKFCYQLNSYLCSNNLRRIVYYSSGDPNKRTNAAFLIGSFAIIYLKILPRRIHQILSSSGAAFRNFIDASQGMSNYTLRLLDCFQAIEKAVTFNFFNFNDFNVMEYELYDKIQNGDLNWLIPRKFLAFIGPTEYEIMNGHPPEFYLKYFLRNDVKTVVRLNNKVYDSTVFTDAGIEHHDMFFADGTTPPKNILVRFLDISEHSPAAIAVHCKAGLGRTGSLIGAYIMKHYHMTAREAIAWMRICRPGSVIGQQQGWLEKIENWLWKEGNNYRLEHFGEGDKIPHHRYGIYSKEWPIERKRLVLRAHKNAEARGRFCSKLLSESHQRSHVPPHRRTDQIRDYSKPRKTECDKKTQVASKEGELQKFKMPGKNENASKIDNENNVHGLKEDVAKLTTKIYVPSEDAEFNFVVDDHDAVRRKFKELGNIEVSRRRRKLKEKTEAEKTQGDRLNEIKLRKHHALVMENNLKEVGKARHRKCQMYNGVQDSKGMQGDDGEIDGDAKNLVYVQNSREADVFSHKSIRKRFDANRIKSKLMENS